MGKSPFDHLFGLAKAAIATAAAEEMRQIQQEVAPEYGERHVFSYLARAGTIYHDRQAEELARKHGFSYEPQQPPPSVFRAPPQGYVQAPAAVYREPLPPPREPTPDEIWAAGQQARAAGKRLAAVECFAAAAERGHVQAMLAMGDQYEKGEHVAQSYRQAALWYQRASEAGERRTGPKRLDEIAERFQRGGEGVPKDVPTAFRLYRAAAEGGSGHAQFAAAWYLRRGRAGVTAPNSAEARRLFKLAAAQGYTEAARELAEMDAEDGQGSQQEQKREQAKPPPRSSGGMSGAEARQWLALGQSFTRAELDAAYKRVMLRVHPDTGGNDFLAQKANEAREVLGREAR